MKVVVLLLFLSASCTPSAGDPPDLGVSVEDLGPEPDVRQPPDTSADVSVDVQLDTSAPSAGLITTAGGDVQGNERDGVWEYRGIPYAAAGRFERPEPTSWTDTLDGASNGPACAQLGNTASAPARTWGPQPPACDDCADEECRRFCWAEDCLNLNVWTPNLEGSRPVMVWIHGGSYIYGSGALYDGRNLAAGGDVVVVSINYRLGALGMFSHPDLTDSANFGMLDELAALRWVRANIAAFGGDASRVTVFGESAGGASVCALVTSEAAVGLFDRAIMQSGTCPWTLRGREVETSTCATAPGVCPDLSTIEAENLYDCVAMDCLGMRIADELGCTDAANTLECLRQAPALELLDALPQNIGFRAGVLWSRFNDGQTLVNPPGSVLFNGTFEHVPFMMGTTRDEATLFFSPGSPDVDSLTELGDYVGLWGACADEVAAQYPASSDTEAREQYLRLLSDYIYTCPTGWAAQNVAFYQPDVWLYEFTHVPWAGTIDIDGTGFRLGAYHSAELPFVFGNIVQPATDPDCVADVNGDFHCCAANGVCFGAPDVPLSATLVELWSTFARRGDPGNAWPAYENVNRRNLALEAGFPDVSRLREPACDMWLAVASHLVDGSGACD